MDPEPFGDEWVAEVMRMRKLDIVGLFRNSAKECIHDKEVIESLSAKKAELQDEIFRLDDENERLKSALKPVLDVDTVKYAYSSTALRNAIRETQDIYRERKIDGKTV